MGWFSKKEKVQDDSKNDFEVFSHHKKLQYFDSACVTLKPRVVVDKLQEYYTQYPSCSGRSAHFLGEKVQEEVLKSRNKIKKFFSVTEKGEILFTKNTTESINLIAHAMKKHLRGKSVIITDKEHNSNYLPWIKLEQEGVCSTVVLPCEKTIDFDVFEKKCDTGNVGLVALHYASNIDGEILDVKRVISIAHSYDVPVLLDAAQMTAHKRINVSELDVDFLVCSAHKMYGPSGVGILYAKRKYLDEMDSFIIGGDTVGDVSGKEYELLSVPNKFEAGLQDYAGHIATGAAIDFLTKNMKTIEKRTKECLDVFFDELSECDIEILSSQENNAGIFTFIPKRIGAKELGIILSEQGICVRSGNFCTHNWFNTYGRDFAIRFSLSYTTTPDDVKAVCSVVKGYL